MKTRRSSGQWLSWKDWFFSLPVEKLIEPPKQIDPKPAQPERPMFARPRSVNQR